MNKKEFEMEIPVFFDSSHQLPDSEDLITKRCASYHGHTYKAVVKFNGSNKRHGMVLDFKAVKNVVDLLDHKFINLVFAEYAFIDESKMFGYKKPPTLEERIGKILDSREDYKEKIGGLTKLVRSYVTDGEDGDIAPATAENIARFIYVRLKELYVDLQDLSVSICEGYKGESGSSWTMYKPE